MRNRLSEKAPTSVLGLLVIGALALRLWHIDTGLPLHLLNPDEDTVLPKAFAMGSSGDLNPHWFLYPTFFMYLVTGIWTTIGAFWHPVPFGHLFSGGAFLADSEPYFLSARLLVAVLGTATVLATYGMGRVVGGAWVGVVAAAIVAVETTSVAYSHMAVTDVPMVAFFTLSLWLALGALSSQNSRQSAPDRQRSQSSERVAPGDTRGNERQIAPSDYRRQSCRRLAWAAFAAGVATSTKYNAGMLILPLALAVAYLAGRNWRPYVAGLGVFTAGFVLASPFTLLDAPRFVADFGQQAGINSAGWLGFENVSNGWWYNVEHNLGHSLGLPALLMAAIGLGVAVVRRRRVEMILVATVVPYFLVVGSWNANFDRYLLPIVPALGVLVGVGLGAVDGVLSSRSEPRLGAAVALGLAVVAVAVPVVRAVRLDRNLGRPDTRARALPLLEHRIPAGSRVATDTLAPPLADPEAAAAYRRAGKDRPAYHLTRLPTPNPADSVRERPTVVQLERSGVGYVVTSSLIRDRVFQAANRYRREVVFYRDLDSLGAELVVAPGKVEVGPTIRLYRIEGRTS